MAKLLLVEDDNNLREIYEARLQAEGYTIVSAKDGEDALAVAKAEKPDLIISDIMMPKISGFEMLDILRNTNDLKNIKVIMLTALGQNDDQQRADKLGADKYLVKSQVTLEDIVKATHELLQDNGAVSEKPTAAAVPATDDSPDQQDPPVNPHTDPPKADPPSDPPSDTIAMPTVDNSSASEPASVVSGEESPPTPTESQASNPVEQHENAELNGPPPNSQSTENQVTESSSKEQAEVDSKIEDFVSGASTDATPPNDNPPPQEEQQEEKNTDNEEKATEEPELEQADPIQPVSLAAPAPATPPQDEKKAENSENMVITPTEPPPEASEKTPESPATKGDNVKIAHKKVINPINDQAKPNIEALLIKEQAHEASLPVEAKPVVVDSNASKNHKPDTQPPDPNSIAI